MISSKGNIFRVTVPLWGEFTGLRWIPLTKASDAELWCFLYLRRTKGWANNRDAGDLRRYRVHYDVTVMGWQTMLRRPGKLALGDISFVWLMPGALCYLDNIPSTLTHLYDPGLMQNAIWMANNSTLSHLDHLAKGVSYPDELWQFLISPGWHSLSFRISRQWYHLNPLISWLIMILVSVYLRICNNQRQYTVMVLLYLLYILNSYCIIRVISFVGCNSFVV